MADGAAYLAAVEEYLADCDVRSAFKAAEAALRLSNASGDKQGIAQATRFMCLTCLEDNWANTQMDKANEEITKAQNEVDPYTEAVMTMTAAELYLLQQNSQPALKMASRARTLFKSIEDLGFEAKAALTVADARSMEGDTSRALDSADQALQLYTKAGDKKGEAETLKIAAGIALSIGSFSQALQSAQKSLKIFQDAGDTRGAASALETLGSVYIEKGDAEMAVKAAKKLQASYYMAGDGVAELDILQAVVNIQLLAGEPEAGLHAANRAVKRLEGTNDALSKARVLRMSAASHLNLGHFDLAAKTAQQALELLPRFAGGEAERAQLHTVIAESYAARGREPPRSQERTDALKILKKLGKALENKDPDYFLSTKRRLDCVGGISQKDLETLVEPMLKKDPLGVGAILTKHMPDLAIGEAPASKQVQCMRKFTATPANGITNDVEWIQSSGKMTLGYVLEKGITQDSIIVELSDWALSVRINGKKVDSLSGNLSQQVRHAPFSSWMIRREPGKPAALVITLVKKEAKSWRSPWFKGGLHPTRGSYVWNEAQFKRLEGEKAAAQAMAVLSPGPPMDDDDNPRPVQLKDQFCQRSEDFMCFPDDIVLGLEARQDAQTVTVCIHFDSDALEYVQSKVSLENLLATDVWEDHVYVFLKGDEQNPILLGQFTGQCVPTQTSWSMTSSDTYRYRQKQMSKPSPCLQIKVVKATLGKWSKIFSECWQHELMVSNWDEYDEMKEAIEDGEEAEKEEGDTADDEEWKKDAKERAAQAMADIQFWEPIRWEGMPDAKTYVRRGKDFDDPRFWQSVDAFV